MQIHQGVSVIFPSVLTGGAVRAFVTCRAELTVPGLKELH